MFNACIGLRLRSLLKLKINPLRSMTATWRRWEHVTKLDPDKEISDEHLRIVAESGTDAIFISGTQNVTAENARRLLKRLERFDVPCVLEPSSPEVVNYDCDFLFVPSVLNAMDVAWVVGMHAHWVKTHWVFRKELDWQRVVPEAYIVLNPDSAVAKVTKAKTELNIEDVVAYGICAERYFKFPIVYVEYSGTFGDVNVVRELAAALDEATLFYGGGIDSSERARAMKEHADVIVVGNVVYEDINKFLETLDF